MSESNKGLSFSLSSSSQSKSSSSVLGKRDRGDSSTSQNGQSSSKKVSFHAIKVQAQDDHSKQEKFVQEKQNLVIPCIPNSWKPLKDIQDKENGVHNKVDEKEPVEDVPKEEDAQESVFGEDNEKGGSKLIDLSNYGMALLRGMGYKDGNPYGRAKEIVKPVEVKTMPKLSGLGSVSLASRKTKGKKAIEIHKSLEAYLLKEPILKIRRNAVVSIVSGAHEGLIGRILEIQTKYKGDERREKKVLLIRLNLNDLEVKIEIYDVKVLDLRKLNRNHEARVFARSEPYKYVDIDTEEEIDIDESNINVNSKEQNTNENPKEEEEDEKEDWLTTNIRVRFIDKKYRKGRFYNKKGVIIDVPYERHCTLRMEVSNEVLYDIKDSFLETIIPKHTGSKVICLVGKYKNMKGNIVEKDKKKQRCLVRLIQNDKLVKLYFDDISECV